MVDIKKLKQIKKTYFILCLSLILFMGLIQFTKALFINKSKEVVTNIQVGDLRYSLASLSFT